MQIKNFCTLLRNNFEVAAQVRLSWAVSDLIPLFDHILGITLADIVDDPQLLMDGRRESERQMDLQKAADQRKREIKEGVFVEEEDRWKSHEVYDDCPF